MNSKFYSSVYKSGNAGITLIALIITIIIILILVLIVMHTVTGDGGILQYAKEARKKYIEAQADENQTLQDYKMNLNIQSYTQLKYIMCTGTQYIDTGYIPNGDTRVVMEVSTTTNENYTTYYSSGISYNNLAFEVYNWGGKIQSNYYHDNPYVSPIYIDQKFIIDKNKNVTTFTWEENKETYTRTTTYVDFTCPYTLTLLAEHRSNIMPSKGSIRLYNCQIYDHDKLIRDYIPVLDEKGTPCLYEKVEKKLYMNQGTGDFLYE